MKDEFDVIVEYAKKAASFCRMYLAEINDKKITSFHSTIYFIYRCNQFTGMDVFCATGFIQLSLTPFISNIISPKNKTPDLIYIYLAYCYIDDRKYRVLIRFRMTYTIISAFFCVCRLIDRRLKNYRINSFVMLLSQRRTSDGCV